MRRRRLDEFRFRSSTWGSGSALISNGHCHRQTWTIGRGAGGGVNETCARSSHSSLLMSTGTWNAIFLSHTLFYGSVPSPEPIEDNVSTIIFLLMLILNLHNRIQEQSLLPLPHSYSIHRSFFVDMHSGVVVVLLWCGCVVVEKLGGLTLLLFSVEIKIDRSGNWQNWQKWSYCSPFSKSDH